MNRWVEFFQSDEGILSMTRLGYFVALVVSSIVLLYRSLHGGVDDLYGWYLGAFVIGYVGGKGVDALNKPPKPVINAPNAESVNVQTKEGDINVAGNSNV